MRRRSWRALCFRMNTTRMRHLARLLLGCLLSLTTTVHAGSWTNTDDHPRQIAPGVWSFSVNVPVHPVGQLHFVNAQYDFYDSSTGIGVPTNGISADYAYDGPGIDWTDDRTFLAIAPTLFDSEDGFIQGWSAWDIVNGKFSGRVYATAPLVRVWFTVEADQIVYGRSGR